MASRTPTPLRFSARDLFGGAIKAQAPPEFVDVSTVREVPDNQEVFSDQTTDRSIIVELLELEASQPDDKAGQYFWDDLAQFNGSEANVMEHVEAGIPASKVPRLSAGEACANIVIGTQLVAKFREAAKNTVRVFLCNIRLPKYKTDVIITLNAPVRVADASSSAPSLGAAGLSLTASPDRQDEDMHIFRTFLESFQIVNPALFG